MGQFPLPSPSPPDSQPLVTALTVPTSFSSRNSSLPASVSPTSVSLILQGFFTVLTLFLVIFNPEMDCGCFGEAIHLTHMQTFLKNIVLCILLATYYFPSSMLGRNRKRKYASFGLVTVSVLAFTV